MSTHGVLKRNHAASSGAVLMPITAIEIGHRFRRDLGDIDALAQNIADVGLLHPVVVTLNGELIAGLRRLRAFERLGRRDIPVHIVDIDTIVRGEFAENVVRKDFLPSELVAIKRSLEPAEREAARERQEEGRRKGGRARHGGLVENFHEADAGKTRDKIAYYARVSGRTLEKAEAVVEAAEADPSLLPLVEEMDRTGSVDGAYRKLRQRQDERTILGTPVVTGVYRTIVLDPPWDYEGLSLAGRGRPEYAVMNHEELLHLPVASWADSNCHLYLWTTNNFLLRAGDLIRAWGFEYKTALTWVKPKIGLGSYFRNSTEHCLFAVRGDVSTRVKDIPTHFEAPPSRHSEKPDAFFEIVGRASYPPYLEGFARRRRAGWDAWGAGLRRDGD
jgi:N6-adenosine-specific RNA methylase IME4